MNTTDFGIRAGRTFVIAEAGVNHDGSIDTALEMVDVAAKSGADAVKFQTFDPSALVDARAPKAAYQAVRTPAGTQYEMLRKLALSAEDFRRLKARCEECGILFMSTPFEEGSADLLDALGMSVFKIPSGELTNTGFLRHVAKKMHPMIVSTGMADIAEVADAVRAIESAGNRRIVLLHCVSSYPAPAHDANLRAMATLAACFGYPVGYSDHTVGTAVAVAAAALGAVVIEKHFTLDRNRPGPDHAASLEPSELCDMVRDIRVACSALGDGLKRPRPGEADTASVARKSLFTRRDIRGGEVITDEDLCVLRPGTGLSPKLREAVVGRRAGRDLANGTMLDWTDLA